MRHQSLKLVAATTLVLAAAACGGSSDAGTGGGGSAGVTITSPADGATVKAPFALTWDSAEPLGPPDSGKDHVHVYVDGKSNDYTVVAGHRFQVKGLSPGRHEVQVSLQHADHSSAGAEDSVEVTVSGGGGGAPSPSDSDGGGRYGY